MRTVLMILFLMIDTAIFSSNAQKVDTTSSRRDWSVSRKELCQYAASIDTTQKWINQTMTAIDDTAQSIRESIQPQQSLTYQMGVKKDGNVVMADTGLLLLKQDGENIAAAMESEIATKQSNSDTTTWDATKYWVGQQIAGKANISEIPTNVSQLVNDVPYLSSVSWSQVSGKPTFATVATTGAYADLTGKPSLFSGSYTDLSNKPTIPTNTNQLTNGAGFLTAEVDGSVTNEIQTLSISNDTLRLNLNGGFVKLPASNPLFTRGTGTVSSNAVNINATRGQITYNAPNVLAAGTVSVTFANSAITSTSNIQLTLNGLGADLGNSVLVYLKSQTNGSCVINIRNLSLLSLFNSNIGIDFTIQN